MSANLKYRGTVETTCGWFCFYVFDHIPTGKEVSEWFLADYPDKVVKCVVIKPDE